MATTTFAMVTMPHAASREFDIQRNLAAWHVIFAACGLRLELSHAATVHLLLFERGLCVSVCLSRIRIMKSLWPKELESEVLELYFTVKTKYEKNED